MDKSIKPKNKKVKKMAFFGIPAIIILGVIFLNLTSKKQLNVKRQNITIKEVIKGEFEDVILLESTVEPKTSIFVNVIQGGSVAEIFTESGKMVTKGEPLVRVFNPNAELNYLTQETAIVEQINNLRNIRVSIKNQQLNLEQQLLSISNDYENANRQYKLDNALYNKGVIAKNDYLKTSQEFKFQEERTKVIKQSVFEEQKNRTVQLTRINESIHNMEKSLALLRNNKENFVVKAPESGLLSSFNPMLGENYTQGQSVGKVDKLDGYKLIALVDEFYISKLVKGIKGNVFVNESPYEITLSKIYPEVVNGRFTIELTFENDKVLEHIKRGMSLKTKLFLSNNSKALLINKGQFFNTSAGKWIFIVDQQNKAVKRNIKLGRENPFYYEVLQGLKVGDRVVTSSYEDFKEIEELNIED